MGGPPGIVLEQVVSKYNETHEECPVRLIAKQPQEYAQATHDALEKPRNERPELILAPEFLTGRLKVAAADGDVIPMAELLDEAPLNEIADIVRATFGAYSLPMNPACGVLYVNQDALVKIGYDQRWIPETLDDLKRACAEMVRQGVVEYGWTCAWPESYLIETPLAQQNIPLVVPDNGERLFGEYHLAQLSLHIFDLWQQTKDHIFLPPNTGNYDPARFPFVEGRVGFFMQGSGHFPLIAKESQFRLGCAPLPRLAFGYDGPKYAFPLGGAAIWALCTDNDGSRAKCVSEFLNYLASEQTQEFWHKETCYVPVRRSLPHKLEPFYETHPVHKAVVQQTLMAPLGAYSFGIKMPNYGSARREIYPLVHKLLHLEDDPQTVQKTIEEKLKAFDDQWTISELSN